MILKGVPARQQLRKSLFQRCDHCIGLVIVGIRTVHQRIDMGPLSPSTHEPHRSAGDNRPLAATSSPVQTSAVLRQRYNSLVRRFEPILNAPMWDLPHTELLGDLGRAASQCTRRAFVELSDNGKVGADRSLSGETILFTLETAEGQLDRLERQGRILDRLGHFACRLKVLIQDMPAEQPPLYADLAKLADAIIVETNGLTSFADVLPQPGLPIANILSPVAKTPHPSVYLNAVLSAQFISRLAGANYKPVRRLRELVVAALLQDVGCLALRQPFENHRAYRHHPQMSAAMIGRINEPPVAVARLVSRHHERLDGTGFPRGLSGIALNESVRLFAVANDFLQQCHRTALTDEFVHQPERALAEISAEMHALSVQGKLDQSWTAKLVESLERTIKDCRIEPAMESLLSDSAKEQATDSPAETLEDAGISRSLHGAHPPQPQPHTERNGSSTPRAESTVSDSGGRNS